MLPQPRRPGLGGKRPNETFRPAEAATAVLLSNNYSSIKHFLAAAAHSQYGAFCKCARWFNVDPEEGAVVEAYS